MGPAPIKIYDKFGHIPRMETTINDVHFCQTTGRLEGRHGQRSTKWTKMKKSIYSLQALQAVMEAANRRSPEFIPASSFRCQAPSCCIGCAARFNRESETAAD